MSIVSVVPNIDFALEHKDFHVKSGSSLTMRQWVSTSFSNNSSTFSCPPPSLTIFTDRCVLLGQPVVISITGTSSNTPPLLLQTGYDALRAYPIANITNNINLTLNNNTYSFQVSDIIPYLARFWEQQSESTFPNFLDTYTEYNTPSALAGINNPLGAYYNSMDKLDHRGAFPMVVVNGATASSITCTIYEPLWVPILHREFDTGLGLTNVKSMDVTVNYNTNLARIISHAFSAGATINSVSVTLQQPTLYMKYTSAPTNYVPRPVTYTADAIERVSTIGPTMAPGANNPTMQSSNLQLNAVPESMLIFVRESNANLTYTSTDTACRIDKCNITFNNMSGLQSTATELDLYNISHENGYKGTWTEWHGVTNDVTTGSAIGTVGSFLMLRFGKDVTLSEMSYPGQIGAFNMQIILSVTNTSSVTTIIQPTMYIITFTQQKAIFDVGGMVNNVYGIPNPTGSEMYLPYTQAYKMYGGGFSDFMSKVFGFIKPIADFAKSTHLISTIANLVPLPGAPMIGNIAQKMGYGDGEGDGYGDGGMMTSRKKLQQRLRQLS
jgi:hypothetical protein